ncbi:Lysosomal acid phosphatase [Anabarilius grahami]|uniref:Lysosomal acid phosphatase n=1 Tax=Anabarilius grahami TaxID=495550 RepID=A0A3N0XP69_ANAGA|nr:Lysosomal acid phosphatase [Anabarilius grahami]
MFPPSSSEEFIPGLKWQPIPVHTVPEDKDLLLHFPLRNCPRYIQLMNETKDSDTFHKMTVTYKSFIEMVREKTGVKTVSVDSVWTVYDTLFCESKHKKVLPDWATPDVMETLKVLNDFSYQIMFGVYERTEKSRLQGGLLLDQIIKNISAASHNEQKSKMIVYSAHDTTIVALQEALDVFSGLQPPYASCHLIELHQEQTDGMFSVEMFYRNDSAVEPYAVSLPNCSQHCPLQKFVDLTRDVIPQDWNKECEIKKEATDPDKGEHNHVH